MIEVCKSNHYAVHLKYTMLYVNHISIKLKGKKERKYTCIYFHPTFALLGMYYKEIEYTPKFMTEIVTIKLFKKENNLKGSQSIII